MAWHANRRHRGDEAVLSARKISISLDPDLIDRIDEIAKDQTRSRSQQIAHLLGRALPRPRMDLRSVPWTKRLQFMNREVAPEDADAIVTHLAGLGISVSASCGETLLELTGSADAIEAAMPHLQPWLSEVDVDEDGRVTRHG